MSNHYDEHYEKEAAERNEAKNKEKESRRKNLNQLIYNGNSCETLLHIMRERWLSMEPPSGVDNEILIYDLFKMNIILLEKLIKK